MSRSWRTEGLGVFCGPRGGWLGWSTVMTPGGVSPEAQAPSWLLLPQQEGLPLNSTPHVISFPSPMA